MLHPMLREVVRRASREVAFRATACGSESPERAVDIEPTTVDHDVLEGWIRGVARGLGTPIRRGPDETAFSVDEPCTHPGHYELE